MTVIRGFLIIFLSAGVCAVVGGAVGYALGVLSPGYYRVVFDAGRQPGFDPVEVGLGLGLTQGLFCGVLVGCVVVLAVALASWRRGPALPKPSEDRLGRRALECAEGQPPAERRSPTGSGRERESACSTRDSGRAGGGAGRVGVAPGGVAPAGGAGGGARGG